MAPVGRKRRKDSGILPKKNAHKKDKPRGRMASSSTIMENDTDSDVEEQQKEMGRVTRSRLNKSTNKMAELKNKMKKKIKEKKIEISDSRSRIYDGNSSLVRKKLASLKTNNRELASTLAASRQEARKLQNQNLGLQQENHDLAENLYTLQRKVHDLTAALEHKKDNEQHYKKKMSDIQGVLQEVRTSLLGAVEHVGPAMEVCHPALRNSGWRISSLSAHVSASDDSDGSFSPQPRPSVLGAGPVRVPHPSGKRPSLAPPGRRASRSSSVSVPPPCAKAQESLVGPAAQRDSLAALESSPILFTEEAAETDKQSPADIVEPDNPARHRDVPNKPEDSSSQGTTKEVSKKGDKRSTFTQPQNTSSSRPSAVPITENRRSSTLNMPSPVKVPSKSASNVKVSTKKKRTKKGLVVQSTSTKISAKDVEETTENKVQENRGQESASVFDLSSGDMFSEPSSLTLKPVVSRGHTSQEDDHEQSQSQVKSIKKQGSANKKKQDVLVTESDSSDEEDIASIPESPGSLQEDNARKTTGRRDADRQSDEGLVVTPRRRMTAVEYFPRDQSRKSKQRKSTRSSSSYSLSEEEEKTGTRMDRRRTPQRLLQSAERGPLSVRQGRVYQDSSDTGATTPHVERASSKRQAFQDVSNTPQGHSDTAGMKITKVTPQTGPKGQKKRTFSSLGSYDETQEEEQSQNKNGEDQSAGGAKRARRCRQQVSYKEPALNTKLRRGETQTQEEEQSQNKNGEDQSAGGAKRARRCRQQVSYKEPTLNTKLRRGDQCAGAVH